jgi:hypothetical protein
MRITACAALLVSVGLDASAGATTIVRKHLSCAPGFACRLSFPSGERIIKIEPTAASHWRFRIVNSTLRIPTGLYFGTDRSGAAAHIRLYSTSRLFDIYLTPNTNARGSYYRG